MTKLVLCLFAITTACSRSNANPTKPGTTVLTWQLADSDRAPIRAAATSERRTIELDHVAHPTKDTTVKLKVKLETATVVWTEDGKRVTHRAPIALEVTAVDAGDFTITKPRCNGPHFDMALPPSRDMILHCIFSAKKPRHDVGFWLYAYGDGRIDDGKPRTIEVR